MKAQRMLGGFMALGFILAAGPAGASLREPLKIEVEMDNAVFKLGEPVHGDVIIDNRRMFGGPVTLYIRLYKDDELIVDQVTEIDSLLPGRNTYSLAELNLPPLEHDPTAAGDWHLVVIKRTNDGSIAGKASFRIEEGEWPPDEARRRKIQRFRRRH